MYQIFADSMVCTHRKGQFTLWANNATSSLDNAMPKSIQRREANGQHADFGMARRYVRMGLCLMRTEQIYLPPRMREADTDRTL